MLQSGSGLPPGSPLQGLGCGRRTAGRSACPVVGATGTSLHFPSSGKFRLYPCSSSPHKVRLTLWGPLLCGLGVLAAYGQLFNYYGMGFKASQKTPPNCGQHGFSSGGGVTTLPFLEKSANPLLRLQGWLTGDFWGWAVPQGTQGTQNSGGGFLRHLRHFRHWIGVLCLHQPLPVASVAAEG